MKKKLIAALIAGLTLFGPICFADAVKGKENSANSKQGLTVFTLNVSEVFNNYDRAKESQSKFNASVENAQDEMQKMLQDGQGLADELEDLRSKATNPALTEDARQKFVSEAQVKFDEIRRKEMEINNFRQNTDATLMQRRQAILNLHMDEIKNAVDKFAKEKNADLILDTSAGIVVYSLDSMDVTEAIIKRLNSSSTVANAAKK